MKLFFNFIQYCFLGKISNGRAFIFLILSVALLSLCIFFFRLVSKTYMLSRRWRYIFQINWIYFASSYSRLCWRNSCFRVLFFYKLIVLFLTFIENLPLRTHYRVSHYVILKSPLGKIHIAFQPEGLIYNSIGHRPLYIDYCHCMPPIAC